MDIYVIVPVAMFLVYHAFNIYTDTKYRITKNLWHLLFLMLGLVYYYFFAFNNPWYYPLVAIVVALGIGLLLEVMKLSSSGDTKMFMVTALLLGLMLPEQGFLRIPIAIVIFHLFLISLVTYYKLFKKIGIKQTFKNQYYDIKSIFIPGVPLTKVTIFEHFPGAVTIMLGSIIYYIAISLIEKGVS